MRGEETPVGPGESRFVTARLHLRLLVIAATGAIAAAAIGGALLFRQAPQAAGQPDAVALQLEATLERLAVAIERLEKAGPALSARPGPSPAEVPASKDLVDAINQLIERLGRLGDSLRLVTDGDTPRERTDPQDAALRPLAQKEPAALVREHLLVSQARIFRLYGLPDRVIPAEQGTERWIYGRTASEKMITFVFLNGHVISAYVE